jgi:8-amino-7-oxononanoate synthase
VQDLYRERQILLSAQGAEVRIGPETLLSFCSNDYLGLANHPQVIAAFKQGAERYGVGAGGSHLISGHSLAHHALEEELADFVGAPRALLFSTGYMANLGVAGALVGRRGHVFEDKLNHASLIDAARLCQARVKRYGHCAVDKLESMLSAARGEKLILTDGVFSMDGDFARLPDLFALATQHEAWLLVDDAHGLGVVGDSGRGSFEHFHLKLNEPAILMGTLGKALGTFGAFVAGSEIVIESLIQEARTYIYTTALPPAVAEATRASLKLARDEAWRRERLHEHVRFFRREAQTLGLKLLPSDTPIQPVILGEPGQALVASRYLRAQGILVSAIRPPTVPAHSARLRITFSAAHEPAHIERLLEALAGLPGIE